MIMKIRALYVSITILCIIISGCSKKKTVTLTVKEPSLKNSAIIESNEITIKFADDGSKISYSNTAAIKYAKDYAGRNTNSCGVYNYDPANKLSDCAHFIAHCLN